MKKFSKLPTGRKTGQESKSEKIYKRKIKKKGHRYKKNDYGRTQKKVQGFTTR
jgi:hypothetical protein